MCFHSLVIFLMDVNSCFVWPLLKLSSQVWHWASTQFSLASRHYCLTSVHSDLWLAMFSCVGLMFFLFFASLVSLHRSSISSVIRCCLIFLFFPSTIPASSLIISLPFDHSISWSFSFCRSALNRLSVQILKFSLTSLFLSFSKL